MKRYTLDVKQAAARLGISPKALSQLAVRREITDLRTHVKLAERVIEGQRQTFTVSGRLRFAPEDCDAWVETHVVLARPREASKRAAAAPVELPMPVRRRFM